MKFGRISTGESAEKGVMDLATGLGPANSGAKARMVGAQTREETKIAQANAQAHSQVFGQGESWS
jgi:hypothetical protein